MCSSGEPSTARVYSGVAVVQVDIVLPGHAYAASDLHAIVDYVETVLTDVGLRDASQSACAGVIVVDGGDEGLQRPPLNPREGRPCRRCGA